MSISGYKHFEREVYEYLKFKFIIISSKIKFSFFDNSAKTLKTFHNCVVHRKSFFVFYLCMSQTIVVVGSAAVGKSALTLRFVRSEFIGVYEPTVEDAYRKHVETPDGEVGVVEIIDTAGTDQFRTMRELYFKNSDGFMLVCSVDQPGSIEELESIYQQIKDVKKEEAISLAVVANKSDIPKADWSIKTEDAAKVAKQWNAKFFIASAKENENVNEAFTALVAQIRNKTKATETKPVKKGLCILL